MEISVRTVENNLKLLLEYFTKKTIKITKYICAKEFGDKNKGEHYHYHFVVSQCKIKLKSLMTDIRRFLYKLYNCKNYYVKEVQDTEKHELYVTKDGEYESDGYTSDELENLDNKNSKINYDKSLPIYKKIYDRLCNMDLDDPLRVIALDKRLLIKYILQIYIDWNACPPTKSDMFRYINYILIKVDLVDISVDNYI